MDQLFPSKKDNGKSAAEEMLLLKNNIEKQEEKVIETVTSEEKTDDMPVKTKKKTNRGRKRKYEEGEVVKLTLLVDKHLSTTLKTLSKSRGKTIQQVMIPYIQKWLDENKPLENPYFSSENKKYTGFLVPTEFRETFSDACTEREITQSFVAEALYNQAIKDLSIY